MILPQLLPIRFLLNPAPHRTRPFGPPLDTLLNARRHEDAFQVISSLEGYAPTPLLSLPGLARELGIAELRYKDEGRRLGLGSFKALGGIYGVFVAVRERLASDSGAQSPTVQELLEARNHPARQRITVTCASAGNHGEAVARGASLLGCSAVIFLPFSAAEARGGAIRKLGAEVERVPGSYDDAVAAAAARARAQGWLVVSDTAYAGYGKIPRHIMQGYTIMVREVLDTLPDEGLPTHVFLQAGVGGMAAAVTAHLWEALGTRRPRVVVVEPAEADCLLESALRGSPHPSRGTLDTTMTCLACRHPSVAAWPILEAGADAFLTIPDYAPEMLVERLAGGEGGDPPIHSQPSGVAGLAGLAAALFEPSLSKALHLNRESRVLIFGTEGPPSQHPPSISRHHPRGGSHE